MIMMEIDQDLCVQCEACVGECSADAIVRRNDRNGNKMIVITDECVQCYCRPRDICPVGAIGESK